MTSFLSVYIGCAIIFLVIFNFILHRRRKSKLAADDRPRTQEASMHAPVETQDREPHAPHQLSAQNAPHSAEVTPAAHAEKHESGTQDTSGHHLSIILVLILGAFVALLNQTLMNVALPKMMTDLNISTNTAQWITTGYMLVNGVLIPITAYLMETFTTRKLFISAMVLFSLGTLVCALSPNFIILMGGRVIQATGAGIIMPLMTNVFLTIFPPEKRGGAMGLMGVAMIFAPAVGPTLSGYIVEHFTWRLLFWIVLPLGIVDVFLAITFLRNVGRRSFPKLDLLGIILSTIGFGGILYAFSEAGNNGWDDAAVLVTLIVGIISLILFVWRELHLDTPLLNLRVFQYKIFTFTTIVNILVTMAMFAAMILLPIYLQNIRGFTPLQSGLLLLPGALLMGVMSPITGMLFDRIGSRPLAVAGLAVTIITTWGFAHLSDATTYGWIMFLYTARMFGMSLLMMPIMTEGLNNLPRELNSHGTAMSNTMRQVAGSLGTAFLVTVMSNRTTFHIGDYANQVASSNHPFMQQLQSSSLSLAASGHVSAVQGQQTVMQLLEMKVQQLATIQGINDAFIVATLLTIVAWVLSFFIKRATPPQQNTDLKKTQTNLTTAKE
ncbi:DHA2 family efflux MFS transporter permease subunit [Sporolactobacillus terrae]|uniref:MFS transporter n=1 Tax=Sporolactobacillus terrae TaxID=269673 RepID=A0ABX5Q4B8_9BACL|nr:DHA2 family efflux MFS transporter permease subunit [Sporolactobacillus terrae]QAA21464.1 MFS transporter [Sporolactobacillus terrae]QAA24436.1 MFS transporter [Sporolactobacillus terrae]UAK16264.1 DHA2 family efflux MFS transporter permease subunit [Sporolactobacillus terrae]